jgi:DNA-binding transcriptional regulator YiaG
MSDIVNALKDVVRRLARKEIRSQVSVTRKTVTQHRRDIARLKKLILLQQKKLASLESGGRVSKGAESSSTPSGFTLEGNRYSVRSVKAQRRRLKLSAEEFGRLLGVTAQTVYNWEQGKVRPRKSQLTRLVDVRGMGRREALRRLEETQAS